MMSREVIMSEWGFVVSMGVFFLGIGGNVWCEPILGQVREIEVPGWISYYAPDLCALW